MDVWTAIRTSVRRWYLSVPILAASLAVGYVLAGSLDPVYTAHSSAILTGPAIVKGPQEGQTMEVNPFLNLGGSLTTTTQVLAVLMDSGPQRQRYEEQGLEPDYEVNRSDAVMSFDVTGAEPDEVTHTAAELVMIADRELADLQGDLNADPKTRVRVVPLSIPDMALEDGGAGVKLIAVLGVLGLVGAVGGALALDGFLRWRHARPARPTREPQPVDKEALPAEAASLPVEPPAAESPTSESSRPADAPKPDAAADPESAEPDAAEPDAPHADAPTPEAPRSLTVVNALRGLSDHGPAISHPRHPPKVDQAAVGNRVSTEST